MKATAAVIRGKRQNRRKAGQGGLLVVSCAAGAASVRAHARCRAVVDGVKPNL